MIASHLWAGLDRLSDQYRYWLIMTDGVLIMFAEPKKDKLENGGEMMRPERPNSLMAGKHTRRICYQGDMGELIN